MAFLFLFHSFSVSILCPHKACFSLLLFSPPPYHLYLFFSSLLSPPLLYNFCLQFRYASIVHKISVAPKPIYIEWFPISIWIDRLTSNAWYLPWHKGRSTTKENLHQHTPILISIPEIGRNASIKGMCIATRSKDLIELLHAYCIYQKGNNNTYREKNVKRRGGRRKKSSGDRREKHKHIAWLELYLNSVFFWFLF